MFLAGMALSVLVILLLSVLYEAIKMGKAVLLRRALLALPRSLSRESLVEPEETDTSPPEGRYTVCPVSPGAGCLEGKKVIKGQLESDRLPGKGMCPTLGGGPGDILAPPGILGGVQGVFLLF